MHASASKLMNMFFETYVLNNFDNPLVCEIGSMDNHENQFNHIPKSKIRYVGVDFQSGPNVDIVLTDPYKLPFDDESVDVLVCSSVLEHCEFFWLTLLEMYRVLKPSGLLYINAPSNGSYHRYPIDAWRFYPDAGESFVRWGKRNHYNPLLLESFINQQPDFPMSIWNDYVCIIVKDAQHSDLYSNHIIHNHKEVWYAYSKDTPMFNIITYAEDQLRLFNLMNIYDGGGLNEQDVKFIKGFKWYGK